MSVGTQAGATAGEATGRGGLQLVLQQEQGQGQQQLHQGEPASGGEIEVKAQRLVDSHLQCGGLGAAPERQHCGEAGEAEHEDEAGEPRQDAADERPLQQPEDVGGAHAELAGEAPGGLGDALYALQDEAGGQRHVEEDMGQQDAEQAIEIVAGIQAQAVQQLRQPALTTVHRHHAEDGDDDRQHQGEAEQLEQQAASGETASRQGPGHRDGKPQAQQGGEQCLPEAETQHVAQVGIA